MPLAIDIGNSFQQFFDNLIGFLPNVLGFLVLLLVGYLVAKAVRTAVNKILDSLGVDRRLHESPAGKYIENVSPGSRPSHLIGAVAYWSIFLVFLTIAIGALEIPALTGFLNDLIGFLPRIAVAVLIFVVAAAIAGGVAGVVARTMGDTPTGKLIGTIAPTLIMAIAVFMILNQLRIAPEIVTITYAALLGFLALAGALAFGLGGRDVAAQIWSSTYTRSQQAAQQAQSDAQVGKQRAQQQTQQVPGQAPSTRFPDGQGDLGRAGGTGGTGGGAVSGNL
jgi:hypothetical protein